MSTIKELASRLRSAFPLAKIALDEPKRPDGVWWLNISSGANSAEIEWRPGRGYGISVNSPAVYGERSDELYSTMETAFARIKQLMDAGLKTEPSSELLLRNIRESRKMTQAQLAKLLRVKQASVSKLESRADMHLSTLRNILDKLGAQLEIRAVFSNGEVCVVQFKGAKASASAKSSHRRLKRPAQRLRGKRTRRVAMAGKD